MPITNHDFWQYYFYVRPNQLKMRDNIFASTETDRYTNFWSIIDSIKSFDKPSFNKLRKKFIPFWIGFLVAEVSDNVFALDGSVKDPLSLLWFGWSAFDEVEGFWSSYWGRDFEDLLEFLEDCAFAIAFVCFKIRAHKILIIVVAFIPFLCGFLFNPILVAPSLLKK